MTPVHDPRSRAPGTVRGARLRRHAGLASYGWMIIACLPMLVIAALLATRVATAGFLVAVLACTAMMALMMAGMRRDRGEH